MGRYSDIWSLGIITHICLVGYPPFYGTDTAEVLAKIQLGRYAFYSSDWKFVPETAKDFIRSLLYITPHERLTPAEALQHPFLQEYSIRSEPVRVKASLLATMRAYGRNNALKKAAIYLIATLLDSRRHRKKRELFSQLDLSGDGEVSFPEFERELKASGSRVSPEELGELFKELGLDSEQNRVGWTEYLALTMDRRTYLDEHLCWAAFRFFDRDGDGLLKRQEMEEILTLGAHEEAQAREHFLDLVMSDIDKDGSGAIDFCEFLELMRSETPGQSANVRRVDLVKT